ncbi:MAG: hypothetical protein LBQ30_03610, partial [Treponema sp.]|nr:hypothetical protein [Treponema sp.]
MMTIQYSTMQECDFDEAVSLLVAAFQNSPFYRYCAPDEAERQKFLIATFRYRLRQSIGVHDIELALRGDRIAGIAVWIPPDLSSEPPPEFLKKALSVFSPGLGERFSAFLNIFTAAREQVIQQPFWSLAPLAILPEEQGKGLVRGLIQRKLAEIDGSALPCFLGTQDRINTTIYGNYGFKLVREDPIAPPDILNYTMIRNSALIRGPRPSRA